MCLTAWDTDGRWTASDSPWEGAGRADTPVSKQEETRPAGAVYFRCDNATQASRHGASALVSTPLSNHGL